MIGKAKAGQMVGKFLKQSGGDPVPVMSAIEAARKSGTQDPIPYITEALNSAKSGKSKFVSFEEQDRIRAQRALDFYLS